MSSTSAVVIGLGSIGTRHARILRELGLQVSTVSRREGSDYPSITQAVAGAQPDYVVIATETARHADNLQELAQTGFRGNVLVEKPLFATPAAPPKYPFARVSVGYNLRFHPVMTALVETLNGREAITVAAYVGQDIRDWRPGRDHRATASATADAGGGVLRDLSHELDYLLWLFGPWHRVAALGGASGARDIDVDDHFDLLLDMQRAPAVHVHMDYLDRQGIRRIRVNVDDDTIEADLVGSRLTVNGKAMDVASDRDQSYRDMHLAAMRGTGPVCSLPEALGVMHLIDASERALRTKTWVSP
ncbi:gfo/Idh/MocA family oxidoreductase [Bradyrhizobium guangzhouense]|uniref:Gfo/Idh/MocA family oxidoreductase n=1 Tax=Bradyrhizobium guangzhouense TaxID=1325095 RepID=A0ABY0E4N8_9BRAD|nr:Gfo/Idh/MocA family oxidoreductase [Bradyrhizobium guangzhouense]RXH12122.1 gfo/Idh/MocA family oxidoreductase [Bradyrhizobium guangzhouense]